MTACLSLSILPSCTLWEDVDLKVTRGWAYYATVFAEESWEISFDLYIAVCHGDVRCVSNALNTYDFRGSGAAQFHRANRHLEYLEAIMQRILYQAGWMPGMGLPPPTFDTLAVRGGMGAGYCMQMVTDVVSDARWQAVVGPWYAHNDCDVGRVIPP